MTDEDLEKLYIDIYDNGIPDYDYKEKFKRYVNNKFEKLAKENTQLKEANQTFATMNESMWVGLEMKRAESQGIVNKLHKLAKAKYIMNVAIEGIKHWGIVRGSERPFVKQAEVLFNLFLEKAEQFISEVDK